MTAKKEPLRILKKKANNIYSLYQRATIYLATHNTEDAFPFLQVKWKGKKIKLGPQQFVCYVDSALKALPIDSSLIIQKELFNHVKENPNFDDLAFLSRATYFRHQRIAFQQFVSFFE